MSLPKEWSLLDVAGEDVEEDFRRDAEENAMDAAKSSGKFGGSVFSVQSAPVPQYELISVGGGSPKRPSSMIMPTAEVLDDEDNLLTISSLTARPLIAKSRELCRKKRNCAGSSTSGRKAPVQDAGYAWVVVMGAFVVQFWISGLVKSYGVLYVEVMEAYSDSSAALASWIPAILSCLCLALAPLSSALCQRFSCRQVVFVGGLFCALGLTTSFFATRLVHLFFTFGVLTGIGGGLSTTPGIVMVSQYFDKHRALANGICVSGTAAGSFVFPLLIDKLCDWFGFHGTILLLGGCMLHVCACATLYRPIESQTAGEAGQETAAKELEQEERCVNKLDLLFKIDPEPVDMNQKIKNELFINRQKPSLGDGKSVFSVEEGKISFLKPMRSSSAIHSVEDLSTDSTCVYKARSREPYHNAYHPTSLDNGESTRSARCLKWVRQYLDVTLLKDVNFIAMCSSVVLMSTGSPYMLYFLPAYAISAGYTKTEAGWLVALSAAFDLVGRLGLGWLSDLKVFDRKKGYVGSILGAGVAVLWLPAASSLPSMACAVGLYGLCLGCWFLLVPVLLTDDFGTDRIGSSYGLVRLFQSLGAISVPPLAGLIRDITGGYDLCFYCMGTCMVLGGIPILLANTTTTRATPTTLQINNPSATD